MSLAEPNAPKARSLLDLPFSEMERVLAADGVGPTHAQMLFRLVHRQGVDDLFGAPEPLPPLRKWIRNRLGSEGGFDLRYPAIHAETASQDGLTRKWLLRLTDGQAVETVLMGFVGRHTACVSTQVGCAMGCVFCATGQMGFLRNLTPGEIVAQVRQAQRALQGGGGTGIRNLVLMGMGEPLNNYDAVMTALEILCDSRGFNLGPSRVTLSTVGVVPGILRMASEGCPYSLAVSLHGSTDAERSALVPVGRRWPLGELIEACRVYSRSTGRRIFFEWTLIEGVNDSPEHAARLGALLQGIESHVNLIPLNPTGGFVGNATSRTTATAFQRALRSSGIPSTLRQRRGIDVAAGCGQLRADRSANPSLP